MTRFTVVWSDDALDQLAEIWLNALDRDAVNNATDLVDAQLLYDPQTKGDAVSEGLRTLNVRPLHVLFSVADEDRLVHVVLVARSNPSATGTSGNGQVKN
jgi:plasmid stabilization system protein ParE